MGSIAERLREIRERIERAAVASGRRPGDVRLVAVSKFQSAAAIREAYAEGVRDFGENYVQELTKKAQELADLPDLRFHLIGHLQTNKVKSIVKLVSVVHSIDSVRLVEELAKRYQLAELPPAKRWNSLEESTSGTPASTLPLLVEVNVGQETQKSGCQPAEAIEILVAIRRHDHLRAVGLMTVPPFFEDPRLSRPYFDELRQLRDRLSEHLPLPELSMGMTLDLEQAIEAGATLVRVGTAIFGERPTREVS